MKRKGTSTSDQISKARKLTPEELEQNETKCKENILKELITEQNPENQSLSLQASSDMQFPLGNQELLSNISLMEIPLDAMFLTDYEAIDEAYETVYGSASYNINKSDEIEIEDALDTEFLIQQGLGGLDTNIPTVNQLILLEQQLLITETNSLYKEKYTYAAFRALLFKENLKKIFQDDKEICDFLDNKIKKYKVSDDIVNPDKIESVPLKIRNLDFVIAACVIKNPQYLARLDNEKLQNKNLFEDIINYIDFNKLGIIISYMPDNILFSDRVLFLLKQKLSSFLNQNIGVLDLKAKINWSAMLSSPVEAIEYVCKAINLSKHYTNNLVNLRQVLLLKEKIIDRAVGRLSTMDINVDTGLVYENFINNIMLIFDFKEKAYKKCDTLSCLEVIRFLNNISNITKDNKNIDKLTFLEKEVFKKVPVIVFCKVISDPENKFHNDVEFIKDSNILTKKASLLNSLPSIQNNKELIKIACKYNYEVLNNINENIKKDLNFLIDCLELNSDCIKIDFVQACLRNNKELFKEVAKKIITKTPQYIELVSDIFDGDNKTLYEIIFKNYKCMEVGYFNRKFNSNKYLFEKLVIKNFDAINFVSNELRYDEEFIKECVLINIDCLKAGFIKDTFTLDKSYLKELVSINSEAAKYISYTQFKDKNFILELLRININSIIYIVDKKYNCSLSSNFVESVATISHYSELYKKDRDIISLIVSKDLSLAEKYLDKAKVSEYIVYNDTVNGARTLLTAYRANKLAGSCFSDPTESANIIKNILTFLNGNECTKHKVLKHEMDISDEKIENNIRNFKKGDKLSDAIKKERENATKLLEQYNQVKQTQTEIENKINITIKEYTDIVGKYISEYKKLSRETNVQNSKSAEYLEKAVKYNEECAEYIKEATEVIDSIKKKTHNAWDLYSEKQRSIEEKLKKLNEIKKILNFSRVESINLKKMTDKPK